MRIHVVVGKSGKETARLIERVEPREVQIFVIHHVERTRLGHEQIEDVDFDCPSG